MNMPTTNTQKKRAVVICPGRGSYNQEQLGYLKTHHSDQQQLISIIDQHRSQQGYPSVTSLDSADRFSMAKHSKGEHASALIYACAIADFNAIDRDQYDICAITGNSMGWYIALAAAQALSEQHAIELITTMGAMMEDKLIGGQLIYPVATSGWNINEPQREHVLATVEKINALENHQLYLSIDLGPFLVIAGCSAGLKQFEQRIERIDNYPMRLNNHGAFHTPMLQSVAQRAQALLPQHMFDKPSIPLIDGDGKIWSRYSSDVTALRQYTLDKQVCCSYYFSHAVDVAIKEFAPDVLIVLGPGNSLGSSVAQRLINIDWHDITDKDSFLERQKNNPIILSMGVAQQRQLVTIK